MTGKQMAEILRKECLFMIPDDETLDIEDFINKVEKLPEINSLDAIDRKEALKIIADNPWQRNIFEKISAMPNVFSDGGKS